MKKILLTLTLIICNISAWDIHVPITSYHYNFDSDSKLSNYRYSGSANQNTNKLNDENYGLIIRNDDLYKVGYYRNSLYKDTFLFGKDFYLNKNVGMSLTAVTGYSRPVLIVPSIYIELTIVRFDLTVLFIKNLDFDKHHPVVVLGFSLMFNGFFSH